MVKCLIICLDTFESHLEVKLNVSEISYKSHFYIDISITYMHRFTEHPPFGFDYCLRAPDSSQCLLLQTKARISKCTNLFRSWDLGYGSIGESAAALEHLYIVVEIE